MASNLIVMASNLQNLTTLATKSASTAQLCQVRVELDNGQEVNVHMGKVPRRMLSSVEEEVDSSRCMLIGQTHRESKAARHGSSED